MSDLSISELVPALTSGQLATGDLEVVVDVSDLAMAPTGTDKAMTAQEKAWAYVRLSKAYRGLVAPLTSYNPGDYVQLLDGKIVEIIIPVSSSAASVIGSANYVLVVPQFFIIASGLLYDSNPASAPTNTPALQAYLNAANPTGANAAGGRIVLSRGGFYTNAKISIPNGVTLEGNTTFGTYWSLANASNCSIVGPYVSTGSGNPNAFYWGLRDLSLDCRQSSQGRVTSTLSMTATSTTVTDTTNNFVNGEFLTGSGILPGTTVVSGGGTTSAVMSLPAQQTLTNATVYGGVTTQMFGVHCTINPLNSQQSGDWGFDPSGLIYNVVVKNSRDGGFANFGRSANVYFRCKTSVSLGIGFIGSFDSRYNSCESDFSAWHGWDYRGSSEQISNCKSYNSGQVKTTVAAASNQAHGYLFNGFAGFGGIAITGCDAQQNTADAYHLITCTGVAIAGCTASNVGFTSAVTTNVGVYMDGCDNCTYIGTVHAQPSNHCYSLVNGATANTIITGYAGTSKGSAAAPGSSDTGNVVVVGGVALNFPGLLSSASLDTAYPRLYSIATSGGSLFNLGTTGGANVAAVLNRMELVPFFPERGAAQTITALSFRTGTSSVATAVLRQGVYTSDKAGGNVFTLDAASENVVAADTLNVTHTTALGSPIVVDPTKLYWIASVPQVALGSFQTGYNGLLAGSTFGGQGGGYAYIQNSVSGALPATITWSTSTAPIQIGGGIGIAVTVTG